MKRRIAFLALLLCAVLLFSGCGGTPTVTTTTTTTVENTAITVANVPPFSGVPYVEIADNRPQFAADQLVTRSYELYTDLDELGRCGTVIACIGRDIMPTQERGEIGMVKPSGWQTVRYDFVDGKYLYNRCHLIGYQLTGENANRRNLITGTRYLNVEGMLPFENLVADYVKDTGNHVMYRVRPIFYGNELVARGVEMEGYSVEDEGKGVSFHIYAYNNQPGVTIDYCTGKSYETAQHLTTGTTVKTTYASGSINYVLNTSSKKFHLPSCRYANSMKIENREISNAPRDYLLSIEYKPCETCDP